MMDDDDARRGCGRSRATLTRLPARAGNREGQNGNTKQAATTDNLMRENLCVS
jgi:hypothetical protein